MVRSVWPTRALAAVVLGLGLAGPARAVFVTDAANDFVPTFLGPHNGDLDVIGAEVVYDGTNFTFHAVLNGAVGTTPGGFYVWGVNRGAGGQGFPVIAPGVRFDRVVIFRPDGTSNVPGATVLVRGNEITGIVPATAPALASTGFAPGQYTWNLWPRSPAIPGNPDGNLSDFAPDNSNALVTTTPAPPGLVLGLLAGLSVGAYSRIRAWRPAVL
ncbi:MAG: hypothetical protein U0871_25595 [Gemmataceae bacterium]